MTSIAADLLAAVELSPQAAAAHDRAGWVGLFTAGAAGMATLTAAIGVNGKVASTVSKP